MPIYDKTFIYDVWSCRTGKGLLGAIERVQKLMYKNKHSFIWRSDVKKFFDNIDHGILKTVLKLKIKDSKTFSVLENVIDSYTVASQNKSNKKYGIPIGNLTSQIFANIYLNEFDRYVKHNLQIKYYLRYGDDFVIICKNQEKLKEIREKCIDFLNFELKLEINKQNDIIILAQKGIKFLGMEIWPNGRSLNIQNKRRSQKNITLQNIASYSGFVRQHSAQKVIKEFNWRILEKINNSI